MRPCTLEDFTNNGYARPEDVAVEKLICPDGEKLGNKYRLKNGYKSKLDRVAMAVEIIACNDEFTKGCRPKKDIQLLLDNLVVTQYHVMEGIDFQNDANLGKRPVSNDIIYYQQFQLDLEKYKDNNNFVRLNQVETYDDRYALLDISNSYTFIDVT